MILSKNYSHRNEDRKAKDRIEIIKNLKKKRYSSALKLLSYYSNSKTSIEDEDQNIGQYFILINSAYAYFQMNQHPEAKKHIEKILYRNPLDGQANLFMAYINLLEDNKPLAIQRYSILLENPFYRDRATTILNKIRYSDNMTTLLGKQSSRFFYDHQLPNIFWYNFFKKLKNIFFIPMLFFHNIFKSLPKNKTTVAKSLPYPRKFLKLSGRLSIIMILGVILLIGSLVSLLWLKNKSDTLTGEKNGYQLFSQLLRDKYREEIPEWANTYREMEGLINLRQFNSALKVYSKINNDEDLPIEVKNKFYVLSTFISPPNFDELELITSFLDIDTDELHNPIGLYYKLAFKVLQVNYKNPNKFLIKLINHNPKSTKDIQMKVLFSVDKAILSSEKKNPRGLQLQVGQNYEAITQLKTQEKNYLVFNTIVARTPVKNFSE